MRRQGWQRAGPAAASTTWCSELDGFAPWHELDCLQQRLKNILCSLQYSLKDLILYNQTLPQHTLNLILYIIFYIFFQPLHNNHTVYSFFVLMWQYVDQLACVLAATSIYIHKRRDEVQPRQVCARNNEASLEPLHCSRCYHRRAAAQPLTCCSRAGEP